MKSPIATVALAGSLATLAVCAYGQSPLSGLMPSKAPKASARPGASGALAVSPDPRLGGKPALSDSNIKPANVSLPAPASPDQIHGPTIALPQDAIEPYLLTKEAGPFMVLAKTFRGPDAERFALALVLELRKEHQLPAYILRTKDFPRNSNIRNIPPTAPAGVNRAKLTEPEKVRSYDEAAVLVGNAKTVKEQEVLWHQVKKIKPRCLDGLPKLYLWREGLGKATRTQNPYVPAQNIFPGRDSFIERMNQGPHSVYKCPARYSLQVADFSGRATFDVAGAQSQGDLGLKRSPLITAADDAERLAASLAKAEEIKQLGQPVYVYHDRTSSRVLVGAFQLPNDPAAAQVRDKLLRLAVPLTLPNPAVGRKKGATDTMIVPAAALTDLAPFKPR